MTTKYYRYTSMDSAKNFIQEGLIYFNSLNYYKNYQADNEAIKDVQEGSLQSAIQCKNVGICFDNKRIENKDFANNEIIISNKLKEPENIFIFCLSKVYDKKMYQEFKSDVCVEIKNINSFMCKLQDALVDEFDLNFNDIDYYNPNIYTKPDKPICLYKRNRYSYQSECRFYIYVPYLKNTKCNANFQNLGQFKNLTMHMKLQCIELRLGNLSDICQIKKL